MKCTPLFAKRYLFNDAPLTITCLWFRQVCPALTVHRRSSKYRLFLDSPSSREVHTTCQSVLNVQPALLTGVSLTVSVETAAASRSRRTAPAVSVGPRCSARPSNASLLVRQSVFSTSNVSLLVRRSVFSTSNVSLLVRRSG